MSIPTLEQLTQRNLAEIDARYPHAQLEQKNALYIMARMHAGAMHSAYGMIAYQTKQLFPFSASGEYLDATLSWRPINRQLATRASGFATIRGNANTLIPQGAQLRALNGMLFQTTHDASISDEGMAKIAINAFNNGQDGNLDNDTITFTRPLVGIENNAIGYTHGGKDVEDDETYRARAFMLIQERNIRYGKKGDYAVWAMQSAREIVYAWESPNVYDSGQLGIIVLGQNNTTVSTDAIQAAHAYISERALIGITWLIIPAQLHSIDLAINISPNTKQNQITVEQAIRLVFERNFQVHASITRAMIADAITALEGITAHVINTPTHDIHTNTTTVPILGSITWA